MKIAIGGNPLIKNEDSEAIYTQPRHMPPTSPFENFPHISKQESSNFIKQLYFITMEKNGISYFYPNHSSNENLCRFEWHHPWQDSAYGLRVGLAFTVKESVISNVGYYFLPHSHYKNFEKKYKSFSITEEVQHSILAEITRNIKEAQKQLTALGQKEFTVLHYIKLNLPITSILSFSRQFVVLPSYQVDNAVYSAVILTQKDFSYVSAKNDLDGNVYILCALLSLLNISAELARHKDAPILTDIAAHRKDLLNKHIEKFYPNGSPDLSAVSNGTTPEAAADLKRIYKQLNKINKKQRESFLNILFAFFSAHQAKKINTSLALVGYVTCLDGIRKYYYPRSKCRAGIVKVIQKFYDETRRSGPLVPWSKRIYNEHRSEYVHSAQLKFEEFAQKNNQFSGLPSALPADSKPYRAQYQYERDFEILENVTRSIILSHFEQVTNSKLMHILPSTIDFQIHAMPEAHIGMPNNGWVRLA